MPANSKPRNISSRMVPTSDWFAPGREAGQTPLDIAEQAGRSNVVAWLSKTVRSTEEEQLTDAV